MMATLTTITGWLTGTAMGNATLASLVLWVLSLFSKSMAYRKVREALGRSAMAGGVALSALGNSKLGWIWNPTEQILCDWLIFIAEQFAVGLRKDNPVKLVAQMERLEEVGSETRATALRKKIEVMRRTPGPLQEATDAAMFARINAQAKDSAAQRLGEI